MAAALVTGVSRGGGIGAAVVRSLARDGWTVAGTGYRPYDATESWGSEPDMPDRLVEEGLLASWHEDDLEDVEAVPRVLDAAEAAVGPLTALVNVHVRSGQGGVLETTPEEFDRHLAINARSVFLLSAEFARRFRGTPGSGRIVNFTSSALYGELAYGVSKAAVEAITVAAAIDLAPAITVNAIEPGPTDTGWMTPEVYEAIRAASPLGRVGLPEDAAELVAFLCSERAGWITGEIIYSDGGFSLRQTVRRGRRPL
jgi:3-oxoacyl-[acyl-carrier protein] reductase